MKNQASSDERMSIADEVIKNDSSLDDLRGNKSSSKIARIEDR